MCIFVKLTGKYRIVQLNGKRFILYNQRCPAWTHPYAYQADGGTLSSAGCGIFSLLHASQFLGGKPGTPEALADFSCNCGGRGDDGTDRPALLSAMQRQGLARRLGFSYDFDGLRNDRDSLYRHLISGGAALCNLRVGHIVALIGARNAEGDRQVLAVDSYSESADPRVRDNVRECMPGSEIVSEVRNSSGLSCGIQQSNGIYWADLSAVRDFNLLHPIRP